ncbi:MAG: hypothetical protein ACEQSA_00890 [Weeksellaceae bacterium]
MFERRLSVPVPKVDENPIIHPVVHTLFSAELPGDDMTPQYKVTCGKYITNDPNAVTINGYLSITRSYNDRILPNDLPDEELALRAAIHLDTQENIIGIGKDGIVVYTPQIPQQPFYIATYKLQRTWRNSAAIAKRKNIIQRRYKPITDQQAYNVQDQSVSRVDRSMLDDYFPDQINVGETFLNIFEAANDPENGAFRLENGLFIPV